MSKDLLLEYMPLPNIAIKLDEVELSNIAHKVVKGHQEDVMSRSEWMSKVDAAIDLAKLKSSPKSFPWKNSANVMFPLITTAALQFNARTYPEIIRNGKVVLVEIIGKDLDGSKMERATRVSKYMSYQLLTETDEWEQGTDSLLAILPVVGTAFRKTYFDPTRGRVASEVCLPHEIVVNNDIPSLERAHRITHRYKMSTNEIISKMRSGIFSEIEPEELKAYQEDDECPDHMVLEQHRYLDLDKDGYEEPYIVTVHEKSSKVLRISARFSPEDIIRNNDDEVVCIEPIHYFTDYHFIRSPDGTYHSLGFGTLLLPINKTMNTLLNILINSGSLASLQGGFIGGGVKIKGGVNNIDPGKWMPVDSFGSDLKSNIVPINYKEPSPVLFQLLQFLVEHSNKLTSVTETLSGSEKAQNSPATTILTLVEQGLKVFTSIMRRQYWSFKKEFAKIYRLNRLFIDPEQYQTVLDEPVETYTDEAGNIIIADFEEKSYDIKPISDPNISSDAQRTARTQLLMQLAANPQFSGMLNAQEILKRVLEQADITGLDTLMQQPAAPAPDPKMLQVQADATNQEAQLHIRELEMEMEKEKLASDILMKEAQIELTKAQAALALAQAEAAVGKKELDVLRMDLDAIKQQLQLDLQAMKQEHAISLARAPEMEEPEEEMMNELEPEASMGLAPGNAASLPPLEEGSAPAAGTEPTIPTQ
jgi:chaperonin GroES